MFFLLLLLLLLLLQHILIKTIIKHCTVMVGYTPFYLAELSQFPWEIQRVSHVSHFSPSKLDKNAYRYIMIHGIFHEKSSNNIQSHNMFSKNTGVLIWYPILSHQFKYICLYPGAGTLIRSPSPFAGSNPPPENKVENPAKRWVWDAFNRVLVVYNGK